MECRLQAICKFCQAEKSGLALSIEEAYRAQGMLRRPKVVGGGSIKEKPGKGRGMRHCKKCEFTALNAGVMASHYRLNHPRTPAGRKPGKKVPGGSTPANDKEAEHAFKVLQSRANKGKLTEEQSTVFDNIEPSIIGKKAKDWPDGYKESVIKLYKDVTGAEPGEEE